ncbi:NAD(P)-dependent alcohol dehydrogenase [Comamonadaceae bacterium PP-2]
MKVYARCTCGPRQPFLPTSIERRDPGPLDVVIDIAYAGICHSDIEHAYSLRGATRYPLVPGHEIAGVVSAVGSDVTRYAVGDRVGVGNMVDACGKCVNCRAGLEQYCSGGRVLTYNSTDRDGQVTQGGYSEKIVVQQDFVVRIPDAIPLQNAAPLLCAGITLYSPLRHWRAGPGKRVAIVGFGGLGHVGTQISRALGAHTTVLELSADKEAAARQLGTDDFFVTSDQAAFEQLNSSFDMVISTVPANLDTDLYLGLLATDGVLVNLSIPSAPLTISPALLLMNRRSIAGTRSGGIRETQEMLDFCALHGIEARVEIIHADQIDQAYERLEKGDVRFRFVIDAQTLRQD